MAEWKSGRRCACPGCRCAGAVRFGGIATTVLLALIERIVGWLISSERRTAQGVFVQTWTNGNSGGSTHGVEVATNANYTYCCRGF
jgi:hypothetical protein